MVAAAHPWERRRGTFHGHLRSSAERLRGARRVTILPQPLAGLAPRLPEAPTDPSAGDTAAAESDGGYAPVINSECARRSTDPHGGRPWSSRSLGRPDRRVVATPTGA